MINFTPPTKEYCRIQTARQTELARAIVPALNMIYKPTSIIEFGCGVGAFLKFFADTAGTDNYMGLDGSDYGNNLLIPKRHFRQVDFQKSNDLPKKYDIVVCLEIAEHLPEGHADIFIANLIIHAETCVLFSAATPGQGGDGHVNEQPHSYWHNKFKNHGFAVKDTVRPLIAKNKKVPFWYRNNIFCYERKES